MGRTNVIREGCLDIVQRGVEEFALLFLRYDWRGALSPRRVFGRDALIRVLTEQVGLTFGALKDAMNQLTSGGTASLQNVFMSDELRIQLGLVSPNEGLA
jgi:hypothetical protein